MRLLQAPLPFQAFSNGRVVYTAILVIILVIIYMQQGVDERFDEQAVFVQAVCSRGKLCICRGADVKGFRTHEGSFSGFRLQEICKKNTGVAYRLVCAFALMPAPY